MFKISNFMKAILLLVIAFALSSCTGTVQYTNGTYKGEVTLPFIGEPKGKGEFVSNIGDTYKGNFIGDRFEGTITDNEAGTFVGVQTGTFFLEDAKEVQISATGKYTDKDGKVSDIKNSNVKVIDNKLESMVYEGTDVSGEEIYDGIMTYNKNDKLFIFKGVSKEKGIENINGTLKISNMEINEVVDSTNITKSLEKALDSSTFGGFAIEGKLNMDDGALFDGVMSIDKNKREFIMDGKQTENGKVTFEGVMKFTQIVGDNFNKFTLKDSADIFEDITSADSEMLGKIYNDGQLQIEGKLLSKIKDGNMQEDGNLSGKMYVKNSKGENKVFLDGDFELKGNKTSGNGKMFDVETGKLFKEGKIEL